MSVAFAYCLLAAVMALAAYDASIVPFTSHMMVAACVCVYVGAQLSLPYEGEAEAPKDAPPGTRAPVSEKRAMTSSEALRFPFVAAAGLIVLFLSFKYVPAEYVNTVLLAYFMLVGVVTLTNMIKPAVLPFVDDTRVMVAVDIPLLGALSLTLCDCVCVAASVPFLAVYALTKHWVANNILAISFCVEGIQQMATGDYKTSALLLTGLFFYDIYMVFFTPMMVEVATKVDGPIKLLLPRGGIDQITGKQMMGLLGLGDIVLPGIFLAMLARADALRELRQHAVHTVRLQQRILSGNFFQPLFLTTLLWYAAGLAVTTIVMTWFDAAQPALLYLVPATLLGSLLTATLRGEAKLLFAYKDSDYGTAINSISYSSEGASPAAQAPATNEAAEYATILETTQHVRKRK